MSDFEEIYETFTAAIKDKSDAYVHRLGEGQSFNVYSMLDRNKAAFYIRDQSGPTIGDKNWYGRYVQISESSTEGVVLYIEYTEHLENVTPDYGLLAYAYKIGDTVIDSVFKYLLDNVFPPSQVPLH